jgi:hypothetical protein
MQEKITSRRMIIVQLTTTLSLPLSISKSKTKKLRKRRDRRLREGKDANKFWTRNSVCVTASDLL